MMGRNVARWELVMYRVNQWQSTVNYRFGLPLEQAPELRSDFDK